MADPVHYRENEEVEEWRVNDPINRFKAYVLDEGLITLPELDEIDGEVAAEIEEAVTFARESPFPEMDALYEHIYA